LFGSHAGASTNISATAKVGFDMVRRAAAHVPARRWRRACPFDAMAMKLRRLATSGEHRRRITAFVCHEGVRARASEPRGLRRCAGFCQRSRPTVVKLDWLRMNELRARRMPAAIVFTSVVGSPNFCGREKRRPEGCARLTTLAD